VLHLKPLGLLDGRGHALGGGGLRFERVELIVRVGGRIERAAATTGEAAAWAAQRGVGAAFEARLAALLAPRAPIAGLALDRPLVMGIVNVTPDSFSDGGDAFDTDRAIAQGLRHRDEGADLVDVGGESTRPGADPVPEEEELRRVLPVVEALAAAGLVVSIDTRRAGVMRAALAAGARIVNDVTALAGDPDAIATVAAGRVPVVLMHMQGEPRTMQENPTYGCAPLDVADHLAARLEAAVAGGIPRDALVVDPGIGFGKTVAHNLEILRDLALFQGLGTPVMAGVSRKRFIGALSRGEPPKERLAGSIAAGLAALCAGAKILRVHDVAATVQAVRVFTSIHLG
jgi:dihydropteroate synthase